ncbi:MAG: F0F1 ATP synthase subunit epsilon [Candidatus Gribaldobacteria bacterium]|nr:F0F1 ATP synthase subunit epsilon [Candidatus Gribaldobacteria bacterium]
MKIKFKIVTPERIVFEEEVDQVTLPTQEGEITVLPQHIPLVAILKSGELWVKKGQEEISLAVSGGLIEVKENEVVVLADTAEQAHEIDEQKAEQARARAVELMENKEAVDSTALMAKMEKELARLKVARKHKSKIPFNNQ